MLLLPILKEIWLDVVTYIKHYGINFIKTDAVIHLK